LKREFGKGIGSSVEQNENDSMENQDETASESPVNELGLDAGEPASPTLAIAIEKLGLELPSEAPATALEQLEGLE
jgi:hypothetical protein